MEKNSIIDEIIEAGTGPSEENGYDEDSGLRAGSDLEMLGINSEDINGAETKEDIDDDSSYEEENPYDEEKAAETEESGLSLLDMTSSGLIESPVENSSSLTMENPVEAPPSVDDPPPPQETLEDIGVMNEAPPAEHEAAVPVLEKIDEVRQGIIDLNTEFNSKIKYDEHKNAIIDKLHAELQEYKNDLVKKAMQSLVLDIIKISDDITKIIQFYDDKEASASNFEKLKTTLEGIPLDLEDVLLLQGVESFTHENDVFDPNSQRVIKKIETDDPEKDKTVAGTLVPGYKWDGRLIRREMVSVYFTRKD